MTLNKLSILQDLQHRIWLLTTPNSSLYLAPIPPNPGKILDIGTGTGVWAIEFAKNNPQSQVLGLDLSDIQAKEKPPNCTFRVGDAEEPLEAVIGNDKYDFIHSRMLIAGMRDWKRFFQQCYAALKPGGWLEVQEVIVEQKSNLPEPRDLQNAPFLRWSSAMVDAAALSGMDLGIPFQFKQMLGEAGFVDVDERVSEWHVGAWGKDDMEKRIGAMHAPNILEVVDGLCHPFLRGKGNWDPDDVEALNIEVREEFQTDLVSKEYSTPITFHWGRKPL